MSNERPDLSNLPDSTIVCRCEEITAAAVREAIAEGATTINDVKRRTRAGMGLCQGIFCTASIAHMISAGASVPLETIEPMTARPPARVVPLATLAASEE